MIADCPILANDGVQFTHTELIAAVNHGNDLFQGVSHENNEDNEEPEAPKLDLFTNFVSSLAGEGKPRVCILNPMAYMTNSSGDITDSKKLQLTTKGENIAEECGVSSNESCTQGGNMLKQLKKCRTKSQKLDSKSTFFKDCETTITMEAIKFICILDNGEFTLVKNMKGLHQKLSAAGYDYFNEMVNATRPFFKIDGDYLYVIGASDDDLLMVSRVCVNNICMCGSLIVPFRSNQGA